MTHFLMSLDDPWSAVESKWTPPTIEIDGVTVPVPKDKWTTTQKAASILNSKALFSIFNAVSEDQYGHISACTTAYDAWRILENTHEGTHNVRSSKIISLEAQFNKLTMDEHESIGEFVGKVRDLTNQA